MLSSVVWVYCCAGCSCSVSRSAFSWQAVLIHSFRSPGPARWSIRSRNSAGIGTSTRTVSLPGEIRTPRPRPAMFFSPSPLIYGYKESESKRFMHFFLKSWLQPPSWRCWTRGIQRCDEHTEADRTRYQRGVTMGQNGQQAAQRGLH